MKPIAIVNEARFLGRCRSCGDVIEWATVAKSGRKIPYNLPIVLVAALDLSAAVVHIDPARSTPHFATCPQAAAWRRRRAQ